MKYQATITITKVDILLNLYTHIESVLHSQNTPRIKFTIEGLKALILDKYPTVTNSQVSQAVIYLNSRKDRSYYDIYRISKGTYMYINYNLQYKTTYIS